jgi:hypothetical protein
MPNFSISLWLLIFTFGTLSAYSASPIENNSARFNNPPSWLTEGRVDRVISSIQRYMEWDIRKVQVTWYDNPEAFQSFHGFGSSVLAVSKKPENVIYLGPRVTKDNFDSILGHELVHIILYQKYKDAIPKWLEEGLANFIAKKGKVDYRWLSSQNPPADVRNLVHPFLDASKGQGSTNPTYHYQASTALIEMIASKCRLDDLLQLSVGTKLENYLSNLCEIRDINEDFKKWVRKKTTAK